MFRGARMVVALFLVPALAWPEVDDGIGAYHGEDYATLAREIAPKAAAGNAAAQLTLAMLYETGRGLARDEAQAARWYAEAAAQGSAEARLRLGIMYADGRGVPADKARAHMWLGLAVQALPDSALREEALAALVSLARRMSAAEIAEAEFLARGVKGKP
jgi:TPR repeat protein